MVNAWEQTLLDQLAELKAFAATDFDLVFDGRRFEEKLRAALDLVRWSLRRENPSLAGLKRQTAKIRARHQENVARWPDWSSTTLQVYERYLAQHQAIVDFERAIRDELAAGLAELERQRKQDRRDRDRLLARLEALDLGR